MDLPFRQLLASSAVPGAANISRGEELNSIMHSYRCTYSTCLQFHEL